MFQNHIVLIFEMLVTVYSDNDSHFMNKDVRELFREHEVVHYTKLIISSSFIELLK